MRLEIEENGAVFSVWGRFRVLEPPHRLEFTWSCSTWPDPTVESIVTVTLEAAGDDETVMTIEHRALPADLGARHEAGWEAVATQLANNFAAAG